MRLAEGGRWSLTNSPPPPSLSNQVLASTIFAKKLIFSSVLKLFLLVCLLLELIAGFMKMMQVMIQGGEDQREWGLANGGEFFAQRGENLCIGGREGWCRWGG